MFQQVLDPLGSVAGDTLVALVPVAVLLFLLAGLRMTAWLAVILGSIVTILLAIFIWRAPVGDTFAAYGLGAATGTWSIDWIVLWGVVIYNTLVVTGAFSDFKAWLVRQATADIRVQTLLMAWSFGALMEGLIGFGYPWAIVAPILISLGIADLAAIRVAALANNAPVSFGALGVPIVALAAVTGIPLMHLSASIGRIVAVLALAPPWLLIYLVSGKRGFREGWPLAIVGSFGYIAGQFPVAEWVGPYLPDITGAIVSFGAIFLLLKYWRPKEILGFGGHVLTAAQIAEYQSHTLAGGDDPHALPGPATGRRLARAMVPYAILVVVVVAWTGPWSPLPKHVVFAPAIHFVGSLSHDVGKAAWAFAPGTGGTAILASWILIALYLRPSGSQLGWIFKETFHQIWGALLVGPFIFGLAYVFNSSGMANSMANGFSKVGVWYIVLAPLLGWIAVALSGSNTSANAIFGNFQMVVGKLLGAPIVLFPSLGSVGAEVGKPVAPQTASVGVSTTRFVRSEGEVIRYNMGWTMVMLAWLIIIGCLYYFLFPGAMRIR